MTIRVRRFHQHPWNNAIVAYEIIDENHVVYVVEHIPREFLHDVIERHGVKAVRTFFANIKLELTERLARGEGVKAHIGDAVKLPMPAPRSAEEWKRLIGVTDG